MQALVSSPTSILVAYCLLAFLAALAGGVLPNFLKLTHTRLQIAISFVAGLMLGLALLGLLPHAIAEIHSAAAANRWLLGGFLVMFFLQRFLPFHHHDIADGSLAAPCGHTHSLAERSARGLTWMGLAIGLSLHSLFDGIAMATAVATDAHGAAGAALSLGTALAVILHKPFGALAIITLMSAKGATLKSQRLVNLAFALVTPLGALLFYLGAETWAHENPIWLGYALAFCAGSFLCIACADLLPELQFHRHDRLKLSLALLAGLAVALAITHFGHPDHEHHHASTATPDIVAAELASPS